ncbi:MAG: alpha/beta hydrolase [Betaproteobacteria bacterium]|nr:MAG: alpha/beta hydrolase [Betaproteobacteria bacterium]
MSEALETIEIQTGERPDVSIVWLHGLGADGNDFVPIVDELDLPAGLALRFVFPHAPMIPVTLNNGYVMRAWYDVSFDGVEKRPDARGLRASQAAIEQLIAREKARGVDARRIVLAGFSQGGAVTLQTGLRHAETLAGLMVLSSYLPLADTVALERSSANLETPIFMAHGREDPVIAFELAERSAAQLRDLGYRVEWHEYPMPHSVCLQEIAAIGEWLGKVLA